MTGLAGRLLRKGAPAAAGGGTVTLRPNGIATDNAAWVNTGGAASKNAALADDSDTTYIVTSTDTAAIIFEMGTFTFPGSITSVTVRARWRGDGGDTFADALNVLTRVGATNGAGLSASGTGSISTSSSAAVLTKPGGGAWDQSSIDGLRLNVTFGAGDFTPEGRLYELYADVVYT